MAKDRIATVGKRALTASLALCMSLMMVPAVAFADIGGKAYEVEVDATQDDALNTLGQDVSSSYKPAVGVIADNGHTAEAVIGDVAARDATRAVLVEADGGGTADVTLGNVANSYQWAGDGIDVVAKGGSVELTAGDVKASYFALNIDNAPTGTEAFAGEKRVAVGSVTQMRDSKYNYAGVNAFSYASGDTNIVQVNGDVTAAGSRGIDALAKGGSTTTVTVDGTVNANYLGVKLQAGCDGSVNGTTISAGTATVKVGGVVSKSYDQAVVIDSDTKGSVATFQSNGDVEALASGSTGIWARSAGGKSSIVVDGDVSGKKAGMFIYCNETGSNDVLVTGTISGKNGVDISYDSATNDSLTVWKIEKAANGQYVSGEEVGTPSDEREIFAKKRINYIVYVENAVEGVVLAASKADGSALSTSHGYDVAREGDKVILKVDVAEGVELQGVYNGKGDMVPLAKDADGNYYVIVPRGGGIYLSALLKDAYEGLAVVPPVEDLVSFGAEDEVASGAPGPAPLLTYGGVEVNAVGIEMKGQVPTMRVTLSNMTGRDAEFDCGKFKVVNADDGSEVAFKLKDENKAKAENEGKVEVKTLAANAAGVEVELVADANACKAGDRLNVFYDDQLLGTFTVA